MTTITNEFMQNLVLQAEGFFIEAESQKEKARACSAHTVDGITDYNALTASANELQARGQSFLDEAQALVDECNNETLLLNGLINSFSP